MSLAECREIVTCTTAPPPPSGGSSRRCSGGWTSSPPTAGPSGRLAARAGRGRRRRPALPRTIGRIAGTILTPGHRRGPSTARELSLAFAMCAISPNCTRQSVPVNFPSVDLGGDETHRRMPALVSAPDSGVSRLDDRHVSPAPKTLRRHCGPAQRSRRPRCHPASSPRPIRLASVRRSRSPRLPAIRLSLQVRWHPVVVQFDDEFTSTALDTSNWTARTPEPTGTHRDRLLLTEEVTFTAMNWY